jgi:conjugal transfer/type IV secretion protein DotA/TraY
MQKILTPSITPRKTLAYLLLPQILPRLKEFGFNFSYLAYLVALILDMVRLIPPNHPYLQVSSMGSYSIKDVLALAANQLKPNWKNTDQWIVYGSIIVGIVLILAQFMLLFLMLATHSAEASIPNVWGMFSTPAPQNDVALMMLDKVFQVPNMFGSRYMPTNSADISHFGMGLHSMFYIYNMGMLIVAAVIVFYYVIAVTLESMQTGIPFGQRFAKIYVPIRLVIAIFLLLPLGHGFSAGQYLTFTVANWGSGFATNAWLLFNYRAGSNPMGAETKELKFIPQATEIDMLINYMALVHACREGYILELASRKRPDGTTAFPVQIKPYFVNRMTGTTLRGVTEVESTNFETAARAFSPNPIKIVFGEKDSSYTDYQGNLKPYCGEIHISTDQADQREARLFQEAYYNFLLTNLWNSAGLKQYAENRAKRKWQDPQLAEIEAAALTQTRTAIQSEFDAAIHAVRERIKTLPVQQFEMNEDLLRSGWGGAGVWFKEIAEYNGSIMSASINTPTPARYPAVMEQAMVTRGMLNPDSSAGNRFSIQSGMMMPMMSAFSGRNLDTEANDRNMATFLDSIFKEIAEKNIFGNPEQNTEQTAISLYVNMVFGTQGLMNMRGNNEIHPFAKMSALGRGIVDRSIKYLTSSMALGGLAGFGGVMDSVMKWDSSKGQPSFKASASGFMGMFQSFALIGLTVGFILYYVIPFMPFLYFLLAVSRWVKSIFEAMVGVPLWALAHLRIDGDGIPAQAAANGYFIIFEIMLRPILTLFGLLAGFSVFTAMAVVLDSVFDVVVANVAGFEPVAQTSKHNWVGLEFKRGDIDQFFFTITYAILLYMMALSSFKLIDLIPNSIMRFAGSGVSSFADKTPDPAQTVIQLTSMAGYTLVDDVAKAGQKLAEAGGEVAGNAMKPALEQMRDAAAGLSAGGGGRPQGGGGR